MSFAGKVWRLLVGVKDALALVFLLLFFSLVFAALSSRPNPGLVREGALLLKLDGSIAEEPSLIDPISTLLSGTLPTREYAARDLVRAIDEAARDKRIEAIALDLTTFTGGPHVTMQEVGDALARFGRTEKPILAFAVAYSDDALVLAAHADEVWVDPMGGAAIRGPGGKSLYYADALARFDINAHVFRVGTYKSAVEPYLENGMSPEARENAETYVGAVWDEWRAHIVQARPQANIEKATTGLIALIAENGGDLAKATVAAGLADQIGTREEWGAHVAEIVGKDEWDDRPGTFAATELDPWLAEVGPETSGTRSLTGGKKAIGVITIAGEISDGDAGPGSAGAARITALLDDALDDDLAALVVRIDSPGGTVTGSEAIRRAVLRHKDRDIPIAISMGNYAASGGYWVATAGDRIFAEPETLTGSIGVFMVVPTFEDLLAKYGVSSDGVQTTPLSGQPDLLAGLTPETEALLQAETSAIYDRFIGLVAESRNMTRARADELGQGRVWTGGSARQLGLIDQFGDLDAALEWAAGEAGLEEGKWGPRFLVSPPDPYEAMLAGLLGGDSEAAPAQSSVSGMIAQGEQDLAARIFADFDRMMSMRGVQVRCLECMPFERAPGPQAASATPVWWQAIGQRLFAR
ncbi:signal peptide peptidase SppA [Alteraurantiacibacter aestuarii]|uniref:Signal peptide peptidase SppA n=1 Tax=Alteraurantiacibacter aestuarii TaxID=650004 RepID=A0A844ZMS5_9SPHN|nr:signal peptide peptidase SppA [Alteraurantiacibacter aestuarii]MXO88834.1 signal peptide peptidase SppA [Alteraurantiacibacter aestuarii]